MLSSGTFFLGATIPTLKDNDVILLRTVLIDFNDEEVKVILFNLRSAIGNLNVTVCILEHIPTEHDVIAQKFILDVHLKLAVNGKLRYKHEFDQLLEDCGFKSVGIVNLRSMLRILVVLPDTFVHK